MPNHTPPPSRGRRSLIHRVAALPVALALPATAQAQAHPLRPQGDLPPADFVRLEDELLAAMRARDTARLEALLAEDFEMLVAQTPLDPIPRDVWIDNLARKGSTAVAIHSLVAHRLDARWAEVTLWLVPEPAGGGRGPVFVVDTWRGGGTEPWRLVARRAAPVGGSRAWVPGDSGRAPFRKMT